MCIHIHMYIYIQMYMTLETVEGAGLDIRVLGCGDLMYSDFLKPKSVAYVA